MYRQVTEEEFMNEINTLNVVLKIKDPAPPYSLNGLTFPYTVVYRLKGSGKCVGFEEHGKYYLCEEIRR